MLKLPATTALIASASLLVACGQADAERPTPTAAATVTAATPQAPAPQETPAPKTDAAPAISSVSAAEPTEFLPPADMAKFKAAQALAGYDKLLRDHVGPLGFVDYDALVANPKFLRLYVDSLADPDVLSDLPNDDEKLAVLINAYNAFTLQLIVDHYNGGSLESITDLHGGKPWDQKIWNLAGQTVSLNQIEHEMIRKAFPQEPRIHWAVVCAAYSCPPLRAEAYTGKQLEAQLAEQEHRVLLAEDARFVQTSDSGVKVTQLFNWYGDDFGDWKQYVTDRLQPATPHYTGFINYDWKLNAKRNRPQ